LVLGLAALAVTGVTVAYAQPFAPGDALYPAQARAVRWVVPRLGADQQARWALDWLARHADWLAEARGSAREVAVLQSLADALPWVAQRLSQVPPTVRVAYRDDWTRTPSPGPRWRHWPNLFTPQQHPPARGNPFRFPPISWPGTRRSSP